MRAFTWKISGAAYSTPLTWLAEAIPAKLNSPESCTFSKSWIIYHPNGRDGVENALQAAEWGPVASLGTGAATPITHV